MATPLDQTIYDWFVKHSRSYDQHLSKLPKEYYPKHLSLLIDGLRESTCLSEMKSIPVEFMPTLISWTRRSDFNIDLIKKCLEEGGREFASLYIDLVGVSETVEFINDHDVDMGASVYYCLKTMERNEEDVESVKEFLAKSLAKNKMTYTFWEALFAFEPVAAMVIPLCAAVLLYAWFFFTFTYVMSDANDPIVFGSFIDVPLGGARLLFEALSDTSCFLMKVGC